MSFFQSTIRFSHGLLLGDERFSIRPLVDGAKIHTRYCVLLVVLGVGAYGASIGIWQGERQALYVAIKLPLVIFLTLTANALLNVLFANLLGVRLSFFQVTRALLSAFAIFALIVGSLTPITLRRLLKNAETKNLTVFGT